jgi:hypothetical protein
MARGRLRPPVTGLIADSGRGRQQYVVGAAPSTSVVGGAARAPRPGTLSVARVSFEPSSLSEAWFRGR